MALLLGAVVLKKTYWEEEEECVDNIVEEICMLSVDFHGEIKSLSSQLWLRGYESGEAIAQIQYPSDSPYAGFSVGNSI